MGLHKPFDRDFFLLNGNVLTTGGSKNLAKGQFAIVNTKNPTANGAKVVSDFAGHSKQDIYEFRLGKAKVANSRTAQNSKAYSSIPWKTGQITDIYVSAPKTTEQKFDDLIIGYDGINPETGLAFEDGDHTVLDITLSGLPIGALGEPNKYTFKVHFGVVDGQTNQEVVEAAVKRIKEELLPTGVSILDYIDVKVVDSTNAALSGTAWVFSTLTVVDSGDSNALGLVQAQYPAYKVEITGRIGQSTEYTILHPATATLPAYVTTLASQIKGCEDCAAGYTEFDAGILYAVTIEDDGTDLSTTVDDIAGYLAGTVSKKGNQDGIGTYTLLTSAIVTDAQIATFIAATPVKGTATFTLVGDVVAVCSNATTSSTAWVSSETCYASTESYTIQLADNECGESRLAELQASYPDLVIEEGEATGSATRALTLTGTSGTANVNVAGVNYLATFATDLTTTAANFVTAHAAAILVATGLTVTSSGAVITFAGSAEGYPAISIANATANLAGTLAAIDFVVTAAAGGCQRVYSTTVITDVVCDECDPIFVDKFIAEAPEDFDFISWVKVPAVSDENAVMGIRLTGKPFILDPEEWLRDEVPFYETSTRISVAGGYIQEVNWSLSQYNDIFPVKVLSFAEDRDHLGGNLRIKEVEARIYFDGEITHKGNNFAKYFLGEESVIENRKQYVDYAVTVKDNGYAQGFGSSMDTAITYHVHVEVGRHQAIEAIFNELAAATGLPAVQAFGNIAV